MLNYTIKTDSQGKKTLITNLSGDQLLNSPQLNKGTAFTHEERLELGLLGKLPYRVETLEEQVKRAYEQYKSYTDPKQKNLFLLDLHATNQVLFFKLATTYVEEMTPVLYTPHVATFCQCFSNEFRRPAGLYISYPDKDKLAEIIDNRPTQDVDLIVVTDGERILGIGDQGVGGIGIPMGKLMLYSLFGGIDPLKTLPIVLDVGTNNPEHLNNPLYLGWRNQRVRDKEYDAFIADFVRTIKTKLPGVFLQWEDFGRDNAARILETYREQLCSFNDDIQGTAVVTLAATLAAVKSIGGKISEQRIVMVGAGSATTGVANLLLNGMMREGLTKEAAQKNFWILNRQGLMTDKYEAITPQQLPFVREHAEVSTWQVTDHSAITLFETVRQVKPTILIGCSTAGGIFTEEIVKEMARHVERPIIFPLSNPTSKAEAVPEDLIKWTNGKVLVATGSPFAPVNYNGRTYTIAQCNNAFVFPGLGLGTVAVKAKKVSDEMLWVASQTLLNESPSLKDPNAQLLPAIKMAPTIGIKIGYAVAKQAQEEGLATKQGDYKDLVDATHWQAEYLRINPK